MKCPTCHGEGRIQSGYGYLRKQPRKQCAVDVVDIDDVSVKISEMEALKLATNSGQYCITVTPEKLPGSGRYSASGTYTFLVFRDTSFKVLVHGKVADGILLRVENL